MTSNLKTMLSINLERRQDTESIRRETYNILDYIGDIGGVMGFLAAIGVFIVGGFSDFMGKGYFISHMYTERIGEPQNHEVPADRVKHDLKTRGPIEKPNLFTMIKGCFCCEKRHKTFMRLQKEGNEKVEKDQDYKLLLKKLNYLNLLTSSVVTRE